MTKNTSDQSSKFLQIKKALQIYQLKRLKRTYGDFSISPQFKELTSFFFEKIYGPQDFGFRNESIKKIFNKSHPFLKQEIVIAIEKVLELNDLSDALDDQLTTQILKEGSAIKISPDEYNHAYKECGNYGQRCYQINLMVDATQRVLKLSHIWLIGVSLNALNSFAKILGMGQIMDFLYEGYRVFYKVNNIRPFTAAVYKRETELNDRLFGKNLN